MKSFIIKGDIIWSKEIVASQPEVEMTEEAL